MKKIICVCFVLLVGACDPVATCEQSELPEFCGSQVCEDALTCCQSDTTGVLDVACQEVNDGLTKVPEGLRQPARDTACEELLAQAEDNDLCVAASDAG